MGQFPADLLDGRIDPHRDAALAELGGPLLARLKRGEPRRRFGSSAFTTARRDRRLAHSALLTSARCENAWGKLPTRRCSRKSYSSLRSPTSLASPTSRSNIRRASSTRPVSA